MLGRQTFYIYDQQVSYKCEMALAPNDGEAIDCSLRALLVSKKWRVLLALYQIETVGMRHLPIQASAN